MTGRIFTADHRIYDLPPLLSWRVTHTGGVPCDSYAVTFLYQAEMAPVLRRAAGFIGFDGGRLAARGIVDDFTVELDAGGLTATLTGRGAAMRYTGQYQIEQSREEERSVAVTLPGNFLAYPGDRVNLDLPRLGLAGTYRVAETENTGSARQGTTAVLTLKEE